MLMSDRKNKITVSAVQNEVYRKNTLLSKMSDENDTSTCKMHSFLTPMPKTAFYNGYTIAKLSAIILFWGTLLIFLRYKIQNPSDLATDHLYTIL